MSKQQEEIERTKTVDARGERSNLDRQYRSIGISAVVAALRYSGVARNPRSAPARDDRSSHADVPSLFAV
jgi:hypothetical protein